MIEKIKNNLLGPMRFKLLNNNKYLITNEVGEFLFLTPSEFQRLREGKITKSEPLYFKLKKKNFLAQELNLENYSKKIFKKKKSIFFGPSLHILVTTLRCNHKCVYCQASSASIKKVSLDMNLATAKQIVDFIFGVPNKFVAIEFQGGEPLINWSVVKFVAEYVKEKNKYEKKHLELRLVSNFSLMTERILNYCFENNISLCTSLDGPEKVHNENRRFIGGNSYSLTIKWLKKALRKYALLEKKKKEKKYWYQPGALVTVTKFSLGYPKEIVNEYLKLGLESIFLRPLTPIGMAAKNWNNIGYSPEEFLEFYKKALNYIIEINLKRKKKIYERMASILLAKILTEEDPNFLDIRSPCGAVIGQLAYDYNGDIYPCDEARMIGRLGDPIFKLGNVFKNDYSSIIDSPIAKSLCLASEITSLPKCSDCVYACYCGVCPVYNYAIEGNIFAKIPYTARCKIFTGIFDTLFEYLSSPSNKEIKKLFEDWAKKEMKKEKILAEQSF